MNRGLGSALVWRRSLWTRKAPGKRLGSLLLALPLAFTIPLESAGILGSRAQAMAALIWVSALFLALSIRGAAGLRDPGIIWFWQKGRIPGEIVLEDWILDAGLLAAFAFWWAMAGVGVLWLSSQPVSSLNLLSFWLLGTSVGLLTHSLSFALSAWGLRRPVDLVSLFAFLSILLPGLAMEAPAWLTAGMDWTLPPFQATMALSGASREGDLQAASGALFQILGYCGLLLGLGYGRMNRWRPDP